jgi:hypothetical protein
LKAHDQVIEVVSECSEHFHEQDLICPARRIIGLAADVEEYRRNSKHVNHVDPDTWRRSLPFYNDLEGVIDGDDTPKRQEGRKDPGRKLAPLESNIAQNRNDYEDVK